MFDFSSAWGGKQGEWREERRRSSPPWITGSIQKAVSSASFFLWYDTPPLLFFVVRDGVKFTFFTHFIKKSTVNFTEIEEL